MNPAIRKLHEAQLRKDLPEFRPGDTVRVNVRLQEGEGEKVKERLQAFEGVVISKKGRASSATFTVRRVRKWLRSRARGAKRKSEWHFSILYPLKEKSPGHGAFLFSYQGWTLVTPSAPGFGKCFSYQAMHRSVESITCLVSARPWPSRG